MTFLPPGVRERFKKPCVFLRFFFFGLYVTDIKTLYQARTIYSIATDNTQLIHILYTKQYIVDRMSCLWTI